MADRSGRVEIGDLIPQLQSARGLLNVDNPSEDLRAAYRRAISAAITSGSVPRGYMLRHTGRDRGDLTIRLVAAADVQPQSPRLSAMPHAERGAALNPAVAELSQDGKLLRVSVAAQPRAVLILQSIAAEASRRGYQFGLRGDGGSGFRLSIGEDSYDFTMEEELDKADVFPEDELAARKYSWQRVSSQRMCVPSGRLVIAMDGCRGVPARWADRKRWSLSDRLPQLFEFAEKRALEARQQRDKAAARVRRLRKRWEAAIPVARHQFLAEHNRLRLLESG